MDSSKKPHSSWHFGRRSKAELQIKSRKPEKHSTAASTGSLGVPSDSSTSTMTPVASTQAAPTVSSTPAPKAMALAVSGSTKTNLGKAARGSAWDEAYAQLRIEQPDFTKYELMLFSSVDQGSPLTEHEVEVMEGEKRHQKLVEVVNAQEQAVMDSQWKVQLGGKELVVREQVRRIASAVIWAKDAIDAAVQNEPHAALAWAGVSILLPVCPVFLLHMDKQ